MKTILLLLTMSLGYVCPTVAQNKALFVVAGQSNAVGQGNAEQSVRVTEALEYRYQSDSLVPLQDPVGENVLEFQAANTGSAWPAFAQRYHALTGQQVILVAAARGGSSAHQKAELNELGTWAAEGHKPLLTNALKKVRRAEAKVGVPIQGIIWLQGERDANAIFDQQLTAEAYEAALEGLIERFRNGLGTVVPFYLVLTGNQQGREPIGNTAVRQAQRNVARRLTQVFVVYEQAEHFAEKHWMKDFVHYNQQALNDIGKTVAERIVTLNN